jgi:hypothetical protein
MEKRSQERLTEVILIVCSDIDFSTIMRSLALGFGQA